MAGVLAAAGVALAECPPGDDDLRLDIRHAFVATVLETSDDVGPPVPDNAAFDWHLELRVDRTYLGDVPAALTFDGWSVGCASIIGSELVAGDRLLIATEQYVPADLPRSPFDGDFLMWRRVGDSWALDAEAINRSPEDVWFTPSIERASTTGEILAILRGALPDTALDPSQAPSTDNRTPALLALLFAASGVAMGFHLGRQTRRP